MADNMNKRNKNRLNSIYLNKKLIKRIVNIKYADELMIKLSKVFNEDVAKKINEDFEKSCLESLLKTSK